MRSRLLAVVVFGAFAIALACVAYSLQKSAYTTEQELVKLVPVQEATAARERALMPARADESSKARAELSRTQIERLSARVNRLSELLEKKTAEYNELKADYDQNTELLRDLLTLEPDPAARTADSKTVKPPAGKTDVTEEMLAELKAELRETRAELATLEKEAAINELHIFELEDSKQYLDSAASAALVQAGAAAVTPLTDLLSDRRAEIRRWAATLLGEIGADAAPAADALHDLRSDRDEGVRAAARKALRRIEGN